MKRILIFSHAMELGGAEKALLGLLETIETTKYQVDLFLMRHEGELFKYIPENIHLLPEIPEYASLAVPIVNVLKKRQFGVAWGRLKGKYAAKKRVEKIGISADNDVALEYSHKYTESMMPQISDTVYDLAISFLTPHYFAAQKVKAKKKIAWIHTDYSVVAVDRESQLKMWELYDVIASISDNAAEQFGKVFPELKSKIQVIENIMPVQYMKKMTEEFSVESEMPVDGSIRLLSVGRFCTAKNFDNVPDICSRIRAKGVNVKWYIIGYGNDEALIRNKIEEAGMQDYVIMLGKKENPYPYMKACDIYVQPSRYEGKCVSVVEAQILHKPVIITNYATSGSQLEDGIDGVIVPLDNQQCAEKIIDIINDKSILQKLIMNVSERSYDKASEIEKVYSILN